METRFENHYTRDKEMAKEIYGYYYFRRPLVVVFDVLLVLCCLAHFLVFAWVKSADSIAARGVFLLVFTVLFFFLQCFAYYRQVNAMVKRDCEAYGGPITVDAFVTDTSIQNATSTGSVIDVKLDAIKSAAQTKNLILLRSKANLIYIFKKDAFTKGTPNAFLAFLKDRGIRL